MGTNWVWGVGGGTDPKWLGPALILVCCFAQGSQDWRLLEEVAHIASALQVIVN